MIRINSLFLLQKHLIRDIFLKIRMVHLYIKTNKNMFQKLLITTMSLFSLLQTVST